MTRVFNFSPGPATLPEPVLRKAAEEMLDWHGTGMSVMAAVTPARWAAAPAPAMIAFKPFSRAGPAKPCSLSSERWALATSATQGMPKSRKVRAACSMMGQSEALPMTIPT